MTQSTTFTPTPSVSGLTRALTLPFRAVWTFFVLLAEANPRMKALNHLSRTSDAELAARGLTRDAEIRRIMGVLMYC